MEIKAVCGHLICSEHYVINLFCFDELIWLQKGSEDSFCPIEKSMKRVGREHVHYMHKNGYIFPVQLLLA